MHVQGLRTRNRILPVLLAFTLSFVFLAGCGQKADGERSNMTSNSAAMSSKDTGTEAIQREDTFTIETRIIDVQNDPAFGDGYMSGDTLGSLRLTWYNNIDPDKTVEICNYMRDHAETGDTIFYDIYTEEEKKADSAKRDTGLFFFKGDPGKKFAVVNAGGGFAYVGAMHDSFPHALLCSDLPSGCADSL